jgi:hypothetical protein
VTDRATLTLLPKPEGLSPEDLQHHLLKTQGELLEAVMLIESMNKVTEQLGAAISKLLQLHIQGDQEGLTRELNRWQAAHVVVMPGALCAGGMH